MLERSGIRTATTVNAELTEPAETKPHHVWCRCFLCGLRGLCCTSSLTAMTTRTPLYWRYEDAQHRGHIVPDSNPGGRTTAAVTETGADAPRARHVRGAARRAAAAPREVAAGDGDDQKFSGL